MQMLWVVVVLHVALAACDVQTARVHRMEGRDLVVGLHFGMGQQVVGYWVLVVSFLQDVSAIPFPVVIPGRVAAHHRMDMRVETMVVRHEQTLATYEHLRNVQVTSLPNRMPALASNQLVDAACLVSVAVATSTRPAWRTSIALSDAAKVAVAIQLAATVIASLVLAAHVVLMLVHHQV
jgi:hypothetical protein